MVYCAAFGCNNSKKKGDERSFFRFPNEKVLRKAWTHYCRREDFTPGPSHRLCSDHFDSSCFERDPRTLKSLGMKNPFTSARLLKDAVPNVFIPGRKNGDGPLVQQKENLNLPRKAFEKRRKAEILKIALDESMRSTQESCIEDDCNLQDDHPEQTLVNMMDDSCSTATATQTCPPSMSSKRVQVKICPPQRTRCHQTDTLSSPMYRTIGTQTDIKVQLPEREQDYDDCMEYSSDEGDMEVDNDSDADYNPMSDDDLECDDDSDGEGEVHCTNYRLDGNVTPEEEKQFLVSESALFDVLSVCRYCNEKSTPLIKFSRGTLIVVNSVCPNGHVYLWRSQPCHNTLPWSNLLTACAIMCSGSNATKTMQLFHHMNLQMFSTRTYNRLQALYIIPSVQLTWDSEQTNLLQQMRGQEVVVGGDARCDSPGYCAKYGSYTIMDLERKKVLDTQLVQCN